MKIVRGALGISLVMSVAMAPVGAIAAAPAPTAATVIAGSYSADKGAPTGPRSYSCFAPCPPFDWYCGVWKVIYCVMGVPE